MAKVLFVNACVREEKSRTLKLARAFLAEYAALHPEDEITERNLMQERLEPLYPDTQELQESLLAAKQTDHPMFEVSHQFTSADRIVIAAPFWEQSFPALLRVYLERISGVNLTFYYDEDGVEHGLCKAKKLLFITTRGGDFSAPEVQWLELGASQLKVTCHMFGIPEFRCIAADGLDIITNDAEQIMAQALERCVEEAKIF